MEIFTIFLNIKVILLDSDYKMRNVYGAIYRIRYWICAVIYTAVHSCTAPTVIWQQK